MPQFLVRLWFSLRFAWLAAAVLLVLGLNQRAVRVWRLPAGPGPTRLSAPPRATVVKQKVLLEATAAPDAFVAPPAVAWLPAAVPGPGVFRAAANWPVPSAMLPLPAGARRALASSGPALFAQCSSAS